jgi:hypothetical protein
VTHKLSAIICAALILCAAGPWASSARAQGSRKDDVVFNSRGQPLAGASIRVCTSSATTTSPCTPTALVYSDVALTQALANPFTTDGLGNYNFYAAPGRYVIEISGPGITTHQLRDVILPSDPSQPLSLSGGITTSGDISAFTLSLAGNLTVAGSTAVTGTLTVGGAPVPATTEVNTWTANQFFQGPSPWRDVRAYGAVGNGSTDDGAAFQSAITAAEGDPGGTVYVSWSAHPYLLNTCPTFASTHSQWLTIVFAGNVTLGSGCPTINLHTTTIELRGLGGGTLQDFDRGSPKATIISNTANAPMFDVEGETVIFRNLDLRCSAGSTGPCVNWDNNGSTGSSVYLDSMDTNIVNSGTGPGLQLTGLNNPGGFGGRIYGGTIAGGTGCASSIKIINWGMVYLRDVFMSGCGIYVQYLHPSSPPVGNIRIENTLYESATAPFLTLDSDTTTGAGIESIEIDDCTIADVVSNGYAIKTLGTNAISNIKMDNCTGASPAIINQSADPIQGLFIHNLFDYTSTPLESDIWLAGSSGHFESATQNYFWGAAASSVSANFLRGGLSICQGTGTGTGTDAPFHAIDCTNGGNGIAYTGLPGGGFTSSASLVAREDSASSNGYHTFESPNGGSYYFSFCRVTGGCPGAIGYVHSHDAFSITAGSQAEIYIGDSLGGVSILRGFQFYNSGGNALTFGGTFTTGRSQSFQDASGTISLTSQLPLSGTTASIGGSSLAAGVCATGTASVSGSTTSMTADASPAADPGTGFTWNAFVSAAGTVTVRVCNVSGGALTPTASAYNVRVIQ